jgi:putative alpha-1,2-mannosidase
VYQSGALVSFKDTPEQIMIRVGVSFRSVDQACANAENEIGDTAFEDVVAQSVAQWNDKLSRIELDIANTPQNVTEMLYSSLYRAFLTPVSFTIVFSRDNTNHASRTTPQTRPRARSPTLLTPTSTHCIAGKVSPRIATR